MSSSAYTKPITATITGTVGATFGTVFAPPLQTKAGSPSILAPPHNSPTKFDPTNPIVLFIIQACIIVGFVRLLAVFLGRIRQPRVISEVIAGILMGPSAFGRIPGFTSHIFPPQSIPFLNLVANIGLTFFLFIVGLEVDFSFFRHRPKASAVIAVCSMVFPFGLGALLSIGLYNKFVETSEVSFGIFVLFIGIAMAITAFPVLARILTELKLLKDPVGVMVLAAAVANDVVGWVLLALAIALSNATSGVVVVYIILCTVAWVIILFVAVKPLLNYACRKSGAYSEKGPNETLICGVMFTVLVSALVTDKLGVHAMFGGFVVGLIIPHEIRGAIIIRIEDFVQALFLPIYFALSGLNTDLGLLANGEIWGYAIATIIVAFASKFLASGTTAKFFGFDWRESAAIGSLMSCKGLVELIVLNIGRQAGILNPSIFAMFVLMAIVTTFATTPITLAFYPFSYRLAKKEASAPKVVQPPSSAPQGQFKANTSYTVVLQAFEQLPALFGFCRLVKSVATTTAGNEKQPEQGVEINALRLVEMSERTSALLMASDPDYLLQKDPLNTVFRSYASGNGIKNASSIEVVSSDSFAETTATFASEHSADMIILPWAVGATVENDKSTPFDGIFGIGRAPTTIATEVNSIQYASFARSVFQEAASDVALFLDRGADRLVQDNALGKAHLFFAFHGGSDDRACLNFIVQLTTKNPGITATIIRIQLSGEPTAADISLATSRADTIAPELSSKTSENDLPILSQLTVQGGGGMDTIYPAEQNSETIDDVELGIWFGPSETPRSSSVEAALHRIDYNIVSTSKPLKLSIAKAQTVAAGIDAPLVIVAGRGRRNAISHSKELETLFQSKMESLQGSIARSSEFRRAIGDAAVGYLVSEVGASLMVIQSASTLGKDRDA